MRPLISAVINVRNEADDLSKCLRSLRDFADEIIVVDMHSTDASVSIAQTLGAKVFSFRPMKHVEPARNFALSKATGRWIILLDPDEYLSKTLKRELKRITARTDIDFVRIPRKNLILGKWFRHSNWWPDYLIRFFRRGQVNWNKEIHSQPTTKGNGLTLLDSENWPFVTTITDQLTSLSLGLSAIVPFRPTNSSLPNINSKPVILCLNPFRNLTVAFLPRKATKTAFMVWFFRFFKPLPLP